MRGRGEGGRKKNNAVVDVVSYSHTRVIGN